MILNDCKRYRYSGGSLCSLKIIVPNCFTRKSLSPCLQRKGQRYRCSLTLGLSGKWKEWPTSNMQTRNNTTKSYQSGDETNNNDGVQCGIWMHLGFNPQNLKLYSNHLQSDSIGFISDSHPSTSENFRSAKSHMYQERLDLLVLLVTIPKGTRSDGFGLTEVLGNPDRKWKTWDMFFKRTFSRHYLPNVSAV